MLRKIILLFFLNVPVVFPQNYDVRNTKYDEVPFEISSRNSFQREKWFYEQRIYPTGFIRKEAYTDALIQKEMMRNQYSWFNRSAEWISLGPTPAVNTYYGDVSSRIASVKFHPSDPDVIYLAAAYGGVWKTTNSGVNWFPESDLEMTLFIRCTAVEHVKPEDHLLRNQESRLNFTYSMQAGGLL